MMFGLFNRRLALNYSSSLLESKITPLCVHLKSLFTIRCFSSNGHSFTVSYLINSCGLSPASAKLVSKNINFENPTRPDSVLSFLRDIGFTKSQITVFVKKDARLLLYNPEFFLPKVQFLCSIGISSLDLPSMIARNPIFLKCSLNKHLIPCYDLLKSVLLSDEKVSIVLKRISPFSLYPMKKNLTVNVCLLRELQMPQSKISRLITSCSNPVCQNSYRFSENVRKILGMGFDPLNQTFVDAFRMNQLSSKTWRSKFDDYRRSGFSEEEIWSAFRKHPSLIALSKKMIMSKVDFLVSKMGWQPAALAHNPIVLCYSLEKRIVPRCSVVRVLILKGLIKGKISLTSVVVSSEKTFLNRFVIKYQEQVPELLDVLRGKIDLVDLGFGFC